MPGGKISPFGPQRAHSLDYIDGSGIVSPSVSDTSIRYFVLSKVGSTFPSHNNNNILINYLFQLIAPRVGGAPPIPLLGNCPAN